MGKKRKTRRKHSSPSSGGSLEITVDNSETVSPSDTDERLGFAGQFDRFQGQIKNGNLIHITLIYLALPMLIFQFGWLKAVYALPLATITVLLLIWWGGEIKSKFKPSRKALIICGIIALLWTATSGVGGIGYQAFDWPKHNMILKGMVFSEWPVLFEGKPLVYNIGFYLPAAVFGKMLGWAGGNLALFVWAAIGVWLTLLWFIHHVRDRPLMFALLFIILSGMDIVAVYINISSGFLPLGAHIEWAAGGVNLFQYSSMSTLLYYVPQHALSGWLGAALFLEMKDEHSFYENAVLLGAVIFLWSLFTALGVALLITAWLVLNPQLIRAVFSPLRQAGGVLLVGVALLYITSNDISVEYGFQSYHAKLVAGKGFWTLYTLFVLTELGVAAIAALLFSRYKRGLFVAVCLILTVLPLFRVGIGNDLVMRTSIPLFFVFWCLFFNGIHTSGSGNLLKHRLDALLLKGCIVAILALGAVTPVYEIHRNLTYYRIQIPSLDALKSMDKIQSVPPFRSQYLGSLQSFFFRNLAQDTTGKIGIRDEK